MISRVAIDDEPATVDDKTEQAIESARGEGSGLHDGVRRQMEHAMGVDFGKVRVHSDSRSSQLSRDLNARAFTTGSDIFFASGQYNPGSSDGRRLLAHELTHVVQQGGAAGLQFKLDVSQPHDPMEDEAERVAEAFVHSEMRSASHTDTPAKVAAPKEAGSGLVHRLVQRDKTDDLKDMADAGEAVQDPNAQPPAMRVSNVGDATAARNLVTAIEGYRANMEEGSKATGAFTVSSNRVTPQKMAANETAISALDDYLVDAGEQTRTLGSFQEALRSARTNYARLNAQVTHLTVTNAVAAGSSAKEIGEQVVKNAGFADADAAQKRLQKAAANPNSSLAVVNIAVQNAHNDMSALGQQVGDKQQAVRLAASAYTVALNNFKTGFPTVNDNPEQAKELSDLKEHVETVKKYVGKGLEYAGKGLEAAGVPGASKVGDNAGPVVDFLTDQFYESQLNGINTKISQYNAAHAEHKISADLNQVKGASTGFTRAITDFTETKEKFARAQATFRTQLMSFGRMADAGHGDHYAQIAVLLAEVDTYEVQLDDALRLAFQERAAAGQAANSRRNLEGGPNPDGSRSPALKYYEPYRWFHANGGWSYECAVQELRLRSLPSSRGSADGVANVGVNATIDKAIEDLQGFRAEVDPMRRGLAQAMNLNMDHAAPQMSGGPAVPSRDAKTGL